MQGSLRQAASKGHLIVLDRLFMIGRNPLPVLQHQPEIEGSPG